MIISKSYPVAAYAIEANAASPPLVTEVALDLVDRPATEFGGQLAGALRVRVDRPHRGRAYP
jgi:hypothetical protein